MLDLDGFILFQLSGSLSEDEIILLDREGAAIGMSNSLIGGEQSVDILIVAATVSLIKCVKDVMIKRIEAGKKISLKTKEIEIKNIDKESLDKVLETIRIIKK